MNFYFRLSLIAIALATAPARAQAPAATQPKARAGFGVLLSPGIAPCAIHVEAVHFPLAVGTMLTAHYDWDFGDPRGQYNQLTGFNAAHVFDRPGRYSITLKVTDEAGHAESAAATIVISPDTRRRIYLSPEGSDANAGTTPAAPFRSLARAFKVLGDNTELLIKAGSTFESSASLQINHRDILIGRYDEGPDPVIDRTKGNGSAIFSVEDRCDGVTIEHIAFQSPYAADPKGPAPKVGVSAIHAGGRNVTVRDCAFSNVDDAVNGNGSPHGLLVEDCVAPEVTSLRGYFLWGQGTDLVCLGNKVANSTREHNLRVSGVQRLLVANNTFANLDRRPTDKNDESKGCIEVHKAAYCYVAHNDVTSGPIRTGPLGLNEEPTTSTDWVVVEGNTLHSTKIFMNSGSHHIMIRNNVIHNDHDQAITISGPDKQGRMSGDITIINNTGINQSDSGAFLKLWGHANGVVLMNNLYAAPMLAPGANGTAAVSVVENDLSSFTEIERNIWPSPTTFGDETKDGICIVGQDKDTDYKNASAWSAFPEVKEDRFANVKVNENGMPDVDSAAAGYALPIPGLRVDQQGKTRSTGTPTAGALEIGGDTAATQQILHGGTP